MRVTRILIVVVPFGIVPKRLETIRERIRTTALLRLVKILRKGPEDLRLQ